MNETNLRIIEDQTYEKRSNLSNSQINISNYTVNPIQHYITATDADEIGNDKYAFDHSKFGSIDGSKHKSQIELVVVKKDSIHLNL